MDIKQLINRTKTGIRNFCFTNPVFRALVPESIRHRFSGRMLQKLASKTAIPKPYEPGRFPAGINLFGFFRAEIGLAQGVRLYAQAVENADIPHAFLNTDFLAWLPQNDHSFDSRLAGQAPYAVNVIHINPDQWHEACGMFPSSYFDYHYNIGVFLWELETVPDEWLPVFDHVNEFWAPSSFVANAIRKFTEKPVTVIPYGMDAPFDETLTRKDFNLPEDKFLVLMMYDSNSFASRKNPLAAVRAFREAFGPNPEDAVLVIKINNPNPEDIALIEEALNESSAAGSGSRPEGQRKPYILITERFDKPRLNSLIRLCDTYISLHRSEGFGLIMAEAMLLGTPVIATNWSSNTEFMNQDVACMVDYDLVPVGGAYQFNKPDWVWAEANVHQAAGYLRRLKSDPAYREKIAGKAQEYIQENLSVAACGAKIEDRIGQILS